MSVRMIVTAIAMIAACAPVAVVAQAPSGSADTRYCMRVGSITGSHVERVRCWTRTQWEAQGVDVDKDWGREGVRTIG